MHHKFTASEQPRPTRGGRTSLALRFVSAVRVHLPVNAPEPPRCTHLAPARRTPGNVKLLLPPRQSRGNSYYISELSDGGTSTEGGNSHRIETPFATCSNVAMLCHAFLMSAKRPPRAAITKFSSTGGGCMCPLNPRKQPQCCSAEVGRTGARSGLKQLQ